MCVGVPLHMNSASIANVAPLRLASNELEVCSAVRRNCYFSQVAKFSAQCKGIGALMSSSSCQ